MNMTKTNKRLCCLLVSLVLFLLLLLPGQAWRFSHLSRRGGVPLSPRVLHQWPRQQQQQQQQRQTTDKDGAMTIASGTTRAFTRPRNPATTTIASLWSRVMNFVQASKDQMMRKTPPFLATTLLWMMLVASRFSNHLVDVTTTSMTTITTTTNHRPLVAAVLPRRTTLQQQPQRQPQRQAQTTKNSSQSSRPLTAVATLTGAVVGGTLLGRKLGGGTEEGGTDEKDRNGDIVQSTSNVEASIEKEQHDEMPTPTTINDNNNNNNNNNQDEQDSETNSPPLDVGQVQARQMVQRILDQYKDEQTVDKDKPATPAGNTAVTVANPAGSPFLPLSTQTLDLKKHWDEKDENTPSQPVSFMDAINAMTPTPTKTTTSTNTQTHPLPNSFNTNPRAQPKSPQEELALQARYAAITDLSERAYQILLDLGMLDNDNTVVRYR